MAPSRSAYPADSAASAAPTLGVAASVADSDSSRTVPRSIASARVSYGGRGQLTDVQQARYGQQLYDIIFPF